MRFKKTYNIIYATPGTDIEIKVLTVTNEISAKYPHINYIPIALK